MIRNTQNSPKQAPTPLSQWERSLYVVAAIAVVLAALSWVFGQSARISTQEIFQPFSSAEAGTQLARIELGTNVAHLSLSAGAKAGSLIEGRVETFSSERLERTQEQQGPQILFSLEAKDSGRNIHWSLGSHIPNWVLHLSPQVPIHLRISTEVGQSDIDLEGLNIASFNLSAGVGKTILTLPTGGNFQGAVDAGVGQTIVRIPRNLAVRIRVSDGVGGVRASGNFERQGDVFTSSNYQTAPQRVDLEVSGGVGQIILQSIG